MNMMKVLIICSIPWGTSSSAKATFLAVGK